MVSALFDSLASMLDGHQGGQGMRTAVLPGGKQAGKEVNTRKASSGDLVLVRRKRKEAKYVAVGI